MDHIMDDKQRRRLEAAGFAVGTVRDFLGLSDAEAELVETKVALARAIRERREAAGVSQVEVAKRIGSSQSRIAKIEVPDPHVTTDLMLRAFYAVGGRLADFAAIGSDARNPSRASESRKERNRPDRPRLPEKRAPTRAHPRARARRRHATS
jgi:DNA-binding XRE family transcriptional regulator